MNRTGSSLASVLLALAISLAACGGGNGTGASSDESAATGERTTPSVNPDNETSDTGETSSTGELTQLNIADIKIASQTDAYAAEQLGKFEDHGLDVNFTYATSGQDILTAVASGEQDVGLAIPGVALLANSTGFEYIGLVQDQLAHDEGPDTGGLVVSTDSDIESLLDLEGRSIAVNATGANQVYVSVVKVLTDAGVDVSKVSFQEIPFPQMPTVLSQGQVDAVAAVDPFTTQLLASGDGREISWFYADALPGMPLGTYWATREWADSHPNVVEGFQAAMSETIEYLNANPEEARDLIAEFTELDRGLLEDMPLIRWDTTVTPDTWNELSQIYVDQELISEPVPVEDLLIGTALDDGQ